MSLDTLGNWLNLGSVTPNEKDWQLYGSTQDHPSDVIRVNFTPFDRTKIFSHVRIRGAFFTSYGVFKSISTRVYPSVDAKILEIPLPQEILSRVDWKLLIEIKKILGWRKFLGKVHDSIPYSVQIESWTSPDGQYLSPNQVESQRQQQPRGSGSFSNTVLSKQIPNGLDDFIG